MAIRDFVHLSSHLVFVASWPHHLLCGRRFPHKRSFKGSIPEHEMRFLSCMTCRLKFNARHSQIYYLPKCKVTKRESGGMEWDHVMHVSLARSNGMMRTICFAQKSRRAVFCKSSASSAQSSASLFQIVLSGEYSARFSCFCTDYKAWWTDMTGRPGDHTMEMNGGSIGMPRAHPLRPRMLVS